MIFFIFKIEKYYDFLYFYIKEKMNNFFKKLRSLFSICLTIKEPPSPLPYRRKLPTSRSVYKTISFKDDKRRKGLVL